MRQSFAPLASVVVLSCLVGCGEPKPAESPTPGAASAPSSQAPKSATSTDDGKAEKAAVVDAITAGEAKAGACTPEHQAALEKLRGELDAAMPKKAGDDGKVLALKPIFNRIVALGPSGKSIEVTLQGSLTQAQVLAFSAKDISIDVLVGKAAASTIRSPFQRTALAKPASIELPKAGSVELQTDSRQVELEKGQPIQVKMTGEGCALVVGYMLP
jgi:hypothetical protein